MKFTIKYFLLLTFSFPCFCFSQKDKSVTDFNKDSTFASRLLLQGIYYDDFIRKTLYTWTSPEQVTQLRENKKLLIKSKSETDGFSLYDIAIRDSALKNIPAIQLLKQGQFAKKRFAWANAWATSMGLEDEKYGDQLIKIELKENAIIGKLSVENLKNPIQFFNLKGDTLTSEYAIENQDRIAVIFHLNHMSVKRTNRQTRYAGGSYTKYTNRYKKENSEIVFREYVVVNEKMINWSYGTDAIKKELSDEIALLKQLQLSKYPDQLGYTFDCEILERRYMYDDGVDCAFQANKCFNTDYYLFNRKRLQMIIDALEVVLKNQSAPITN